MQTLQEYRAEIDAEFADTIRTCPKGLESLRPPRLPSIGHLQSGELGLLGTCTAGAVSALYLGAELANHWQIGGWIGLWWFASVMLAGGLLGASIALVIVFRGFRRG